MNAISLLGDQAKTAHQFLEMTIADVTPEVLHKAPGGTAHPVSGIYAHLVLSEDMIVAGMLKGSSPLSATAGDRAGVSAPHPEPSTADWARDFQKWSDTVQVDLPKLREFAKEVYAQTDAYLGSLTDADLDREIDLSSMGMGKSTVGWVISNFVVGHVNSIMGEIAALKGIQGLKGYPF